jgi:plasmid maintenance system antidote protein VapI
MAQQKKQLKDITSGTATKWRKEVVDSQRNRSVIRKANKFVLLLMDYMDANNIKQKELATLCSVSPQQVNKWLKGGNNITLETICKIEDALDIDIFLPEIQPRRRILESEIKSMTRISHSE